jgi:GTP-binding protein
MFIDEVEITVKGGRGGNGKVAFFPKKSGPAGGDGGNGGNVYARLNPTHSNLNKYWEKRSYEAENGIPGGSFNKKGSNGEDVILQFPPGTAFIDLETGKEVELINPNEDLLLASGGIGGRGNDAFKSSTNQTPRTAEAGADGQKKQIKVIMRLIADFGLIGLPNAGKSSLLNELTAANVKTADYPFTTLEPNLGVTEGKILADIPGLIEGASQGKGLGVKFLKHIEKVPVLLHCIAADSPDVIKDYETVIKELAQFNPVLATRQQIIILSKHDLVDKKTLEKKKKVLAKLGKPVLFASIHDWDSLQELKKHLTTIE